MRSSTSTTRCGRSSRRSSAALLLVVAASAAGCFPRDGVGFVAADFTVTECPPGDENDDLVGYRFEPEYFGVTRFYDDTTIQLLEHSVLVEETDGLSIKLRLGLLEAAGQIAEAGDSGRYELTEAPLSLPLEFDGLGARASLSMFQTCFDYPTVHAVSGTLRFDRLRLAVDPEDLGRDERVEGSLTATITRGGGEDVVGTMTAEFAFDVPRRPLLSVY